MTQHEGDRPLDPPERARRVTRVGGEEAPRRGGLGQPAADEDLRKALGQWVRKEIGPIATPDAIQFAPGLPKTRSGKIMRRLLKNLAEGEELGDTSTLVDPSVVEEMQKQMNS